MSGWTCQRQSKGVKCGQWNQACRRKVLCVREAEASGSGSRRTCGRF